MVAGKGVLNDLFLHFGGMNFIFLAVLRTKFPFDSLYEKLKRGLAFVYVLGGQTTS